MRISPDFSQETKPIEPGNYPVRITSVEMKTGKNTGDRYLAWGLEITMGQHAGKKLTYNTMIEGRGAGMLKGFLRTFWPTYEGGEFEAEHCIGERLLAKIDYEIDERDPDKKYARVKGVVPIDEPQERSSNEDAPL